MPSCVTPGSRAAPHGSRQGRAQQRLQGAVWLADARSEQAPGRWDGEYRGNRHTEDGEGCCTLRFHRKEKNKRAYTISSRKRWS